MSGGHFDYAQYKIEQIADSIEQLIQDQEQALAYELYSEQTVQEFRNAVALLRRAYVYAQRIDWLVSGDDGEQCFHSRLASELAQLAK
jgi:hypothetical protein